MTRMISLNALTAGISRLKTKGSPDPQSLYDLVNGYVTPSGSVEARPGSAADTVLPVGTRGLMSYRGLKYVFSDHFIDLAEFPGYRCTILTHKDVDTGATLAKVHFAEPFLMYPYVVAEWSDGAIFHYWLQGEGDENKLWQANTTYRLYEIVQPTTINGFTYRANRLTAPGTIWAPNVERDVDDVVEPTTENGFEYVAIEVYGSPPRSGPTEPNWPAEDGAIIVEEADLAPPPPASGGGSGGSNVPPDVEDRYGRSRNIDKGIY